MYGASAPISRNKERIQKLKEAGDSGYIYQNGLDKASMTCLLEIWKIFLEEQLHLKYYKKEV